MWLTLAEDSKGQIFLNAIPGNFVDPTEPIAFAVGLSSDNAEEHVRHCYTISDTRSFDQDPRFGISVLAEIGSRALSPAINAVKRSVASMPARPQASVEPVSAPAPQRRSAAPTRSLDVTDRASMVLSGVRQPEAKVVAPESRAKRPYKRRPIVEFPNPLWTEWEDVDGFAAALKLSDLSANRPFHVQLEKLANETWCPDGSTRWFYERAAGAYNVMLLRDGTTPARRKKLQEIVAPKRKLSKTDVAKYLEAWRGKPAQVAQAGEKNFAAFMSALDENAALVPNPLDPKWYKGLIAKVILYKAVEQMIMTKEAKDVFRQGWVNIATYVLAIVGDRLGDSIDLEQIWQQQDISKPFRELLWDWAVVVNAEFTRLAPGQQIFLEEVDLIRGHASGKEGFAAIAAPLAKAAFDRIGLRL